MTIWLPLPKTLFQLKNMPYQLQMLSTVTKVIVNKSENLDNATLQTPHTSVSRAGNVSIKVLWIWFQRLGGNLFVQYWISLIPVLTSWYCSNWWRMWRRSATQRTRCRPAATSPGSTMPRSRHPTSSLGWWRRRSVDSPGNLMRTETSRWD